ncbi:hypothetical protein GCM10010273_27640 [Streptomyces lavendulocolor]
MDGEALGRAYRWADVVQFLRRAGVELDEHEVAESGLIEWIGGGPYLWGELDH